MKVVNIHKRTITQHKDELSELLKTLGSKNDKFWPKHKWPAMKIENGLHVGNKGRHGPIKYSIVEYIEGELIKFKFSEPKGFNGTHELRLKSKDDSTTEIIHEIRMKTSLRASLLWLFTIRWLHDALIEDAFDTVENYFSLDEKYTAHGSWVKLLRALYK